MSMIENQIIPAAEKERILAEETAGYPVISRKMTKEEMKKYDIKECRTCKKIKPRAMFAKDITRTDGLRGQCKDCQSADQRKRQGSKAANPSQKSKPERDELESLRKENEELKKLLEGAKSTVAEVRAAANERGERYFSVYEARRLGRNHCPDMEGSDHYKSNDIEPMDLIIATGDGPAFCRSNIIKYARRSKTTRNITDLLKVRDYTNIAIGLLLKEQEERHHVE